MRLGLPPSVVMELQYLWGPVLPNLMTHSTPHYLLYLVDSLTLTLNHLQMFPSQLITPFLNLRHFKIRALDAEENKIFQFVYPSSLEGTVGQTKIKQVFIFFYTSQEIISLWEKPQIIAMNCPTYL